MSNIAIPNWAKPLVTVAYSATGWLITEIPVALGIIPATIDGHSTALIGGGLAFILSGAKYIHSHLAPYITSLKTPVQAQSTPVSASMPQPSPQPKASALTLSFSPNPVAKGGTTVLSLTGGTPGGKWQLFQTGLPQDDTGQLTSVHLFDSAGNSSLSINTAAESPIQGVLSAEGAVTAYAVDLSSNVDSPDVELKSA